MPTVRNAIEAFVSGSLDYGGLQDELQAAAHSGVPRDLVFDELRLVDGEIGLSPALNNLIARAIDRHFGASPEAGDQTVPGDGVDETRPGRPRSVAKVDRAAAERPAKPSPVEPAESESESAAAGAGAAPPNAAPPPETPAPRPPADASSRRRSSAR